MSTRASRFNAKHNSFTRRKGKTRVSVCCNFAVFKLPEHIQGASIDYFYECCKCERKCETVIV